MYIKGWGDTLRTIQLIDFCCFLLESHDKKERCNMVITWDVPNLEKGHLLVGLRHRPCEQDLVQKQV